MKADPKATASFVASFFDELMCGGVRHVVVSPGSRSTPLAMVAYEASRRFPDKLHVHLDVDERSAAFFALGIAKATGMPACAICTSGTAVANYYPAVLEAESSRVPLLLLTGDRPPQLQGLGAPQTCDQLKAFGSHVALFTNMPLPASDDASLTFARQAAREALIAAGQGASNGMPVQLNFPFDEPLKPDMSDDAVFETGRSKHAVLLRPSKVDVSLCAEVAQVLQGKRVMILAGEGSAPTLADAKRLLAWAALYDIPVLADPLSGLRSFDDALVIDCYDSVFAHEGYPVCDAVIRFGRYPVSKRTTTCLAADKPLQVVVDAHETRDFLCATDVFVQCTPVEFVQACTSQEAEPFVLSEEQRAFADAWIEANCAQASRIKAAAEVDGVTHESDKDEASVFEGAFVRTLIDELPAESCFFVANSMSIRAVDTFYEKSARRVQVLCNRGLNGIDGTVSSALGAAQAYKQTTLLIGDLAFLHDANALALQRELLRVADSASVVIVLLNNNGGGIFDMLPQRSDEPYFERLFLTPQDVDFSCMAAAFNVPYKAVESPEELRVAYGAALGQPGITLIEAKIALRGLPERYAACW